MIDKYMIDVSIFNKYVGIEYDCRNIDCWGLVCLVYKNELNIELPQKRIICDNLTDKLAEIQIALKDLYKYFDNVTDEYKAVVDYNEYNVIKDDNKYKTFDILQFRIRDLPFHCGIVIDNKHMLHSENKRLGSTIEDYHQQKWKNRFLRAYRYKYL